MTLGCNSHARLSPATRVRWRSMRPVADQETLVREFMDAGKDIEDAKARRVAAARALAEQLGLSETARRLGYTRTRLGQLLGPDRPRGVPSVPSLKSLVDAGALSPGEILLLPRKSPAPPDECVVEPDGRLRVVEGRHPGVYNTPAACVRALTGKHGDGFSRLRSPDRGFATLAQLRAELERRTAKEAARSGD